jgi:hypothetical protein
MITIQLRENGFKIVLKGLVDLEDVRRFAFGLKDEMAGLGQPFVMVIDVLAFDFFAADAQAEFETALEEAVERGLSRISVLAYSTGRAGLFTEMMLRLDAMDMYQYIDMSYEEDWEEELEASLAIGD